MSIAVFEKRVRDACQSRLVHEQDRAALGIELPLALEDGFLSTRCVSASLMRTDGRRERSVFEIETHFPVLPLESTCRTSYEGI